MGRDVGGDNCLVLPPVKTGGYKMIGDYRLPSIPPINVQSAKSIVFFALRSRSIGSPFEGGWGDEPFYNIDNEQIN